MFLKRIEMRGFKSFADFVSIAFDQSVTGIVGPNGCGKSNITDAVRWVLGEQSPKSLRGATMTDVIFNGSDHRRKVNLAEVTLVFDNHQKLLDIGYETVEITRRLDRDTHEGMYFINRQPCRLKDVQDLVADTGIGKDSLSMISQGNISFFAEARPIERRAFFEEVAGVSKYKRRKIESISKLERTAGHMERLQDILDEITRQIEPLGRAARKAERYQEKKTLLAGIEVQALTAEITHLDEELAQLTSALFDVDTQVASLQAELGLLDHQDQESSEQIRQLDTEIQVAQETLMQTMQKIQTLEKRKVEIEEKRKYLLETGTRKQKQEQIRALYQEAKSEFEDREHRRQELIAAIDLSRQQSMTFNRQTLDHQSELDRLELEQRRLVSRRDVLTHMLERPFANDAGVRSVLDHQQALVGVHGVVAQLLEADAGYEQALATALGAAQSHLVTTDEQAARSAITFLKRNQSGRATFIPMTVLRSHPVRRDALAVVTGFDGYLGIMSEFVQCTKDYEQLRDALIGNVLVCNDLACANELAKALNYQYKIVTTDGDVVHRGGTMTGGWKRQADSLVSARAQLKEIEQRLTQIDPVIRGHQQSLDHLRLRKAKTDEQLMQDRLNLAQVESLTELKKEKAERLLEELKTLDPQHETDKESVDDTLATELNALFDQRDKLHWTIRTRREQRMNLAQEQERRQVRIRQRRQTLGELTQKQHEGQLLQTRFQTRREQLLQRLSVEYRMTYEHARSQFGDDIQNEDPAKIQTLREELERMGNVNMNAPQEYAQLKQRHDFLQGQMDELTTSKDKLIGLIDEMDELMKQQFKDMFDKVNDELQNVFADLFRGGSAQLILEDPEDLLNTGVDIKVRPPGKQVQNLRLFSGGEKTLIAISVLFAMLRARHMPLCIFDEVEAALDPSNVERFADYLKRNSEQTQFVVVTHRQGTMERCDVLYGVTMPEQGVSKMLKVRLSEAVDLAEGGVGDGLA